MGMMFCLFLIFSFLDVISCFNLFLLEAFKVQYKQANLLMWSTFVRQVCCVWSLLCLVCLEFGCVLCPAHIGHGFTGKYWRHCPSFIDITQGGEKRSRSGTWCYITEKFVFKKKYYFNTRFSRSLNCVTSELHYFPCNIWILIKMSFLFGWLCFLIYIYNRKILCHVF